MARVRPAGVVEVDVAADAFSGCAHRLVGVKSIGFPQSLPVVRMHIMHMSKARGLATYPVEKHGQAPGHLPQINRGASMREASGRHRHFGLKGAALGAIA